MPLDRQPIRGERGAIGPIGPDVRVSLEMISRRASHGAGLFFHAVLVRFHKGDRTMPTRPFNLVYGEVHDGLIFIPEAEALELTIIHRAVRTASTWGELRGLLPGWAYEQILGGLDEAVMFDEFVEKLRAGNRSLSLREAREEFDGLSIGERFPQDIDAFTSEQIWGYLDGDWPEFPVKRMLDWVPKAIKQKFGQMEDTLLNGEQLHFEVEDEAEIVKAFGGAGYTCSRDGDLVYWACGGNSATVEPEE
jgi:hypothetical protein